MIWGGSNFSAILRFFTFHSDTHPNKWQWVLIVNNVEANWDGIHNIVDWRKTDHQPIIIGNCRISSIIHFSHSTLLDARTSHSMSFGTLNFDYFFFSGKWFQDVNISFGISTDFNGWAQWNQIVNCFVKLLIF